jgi:hypothetical protein
MVVKTVRLAFKDRQMCSKRHKEALVEGPAFQTGCKMSRPNLFVRHAECTNLIISYNMLPFRRSFMVFTENEVL